MSESWETSIQKGIRLRQAGKHTTALKFFLMLEKTYPGIGEIAYQIASTYDNLGQERLAIPSYQKALSLGLAKESLSDAYVGLGSSLRAVGEYTQAHSVFKKAMKLFPKQAIFVVFEAMTLWNLEQTETAMDNLLFLMKKHHLDASVLMYRKALRYYMKNLTKKSR
jgi:tetratricopeptide (TPR) repeat protein